MSTASVFSFFHFLVLYIQHKHLVISRFSNCCFLKLNHLPLFPPLFNTETGSAGIWMHPWRGWSWRCHQQPNQHNKILHIWGSRGKTKAASFQHHIFSSSRITRCHSMNLYHFFNLFAGWKLSSTGKFYFRYGKLWASIENLCLAFLALSNKFQRLLLILTFAEQMPAGDLRRSENLQGRAEEPQGSEGADIHWRHDASKHFHLVPSIFNGVLGAALRCAVTGELRIWQVDTGFPRSKTGRC